MPISNSLTLTCSNLLKKYFSVSCSHGIFGRKVLHIQNSRSVEHLRLSSYIMYILFYISKQVQFSVLGRK